VWNLVLYTIIKYSKSSRIANGMNEKKILSEYDLAFSFINGNDEALGELYSLKKNY
jgi:hypothetical protein